MRYAAGIFYAVAISHSQAGISAIGTAVCIFLGTVTALFAVEAIVQKHVRE